MSAFGIIARRDGAIVRYRLPCNRQNADQLLAETMTAHPDCEITLYDGEAVLLSVGPARHSGEPICP